MNNKLKNTLLCTILLPVGITWLAMGAFISSKSRTTPPRWNGTAAGKCKSSSKRTGYKCVSTSNGTSWFEYGDKIVDYATVRHLKYKDTEPKLRRYTYNSGPAVRYKLVSIPANRKS